MAQDNASPKQLVLQELSQSASTLRFDVLLALLPLVGSLSTDASGRLTPGTVRRAYMRWLILRRYAELQCHPTTKGWTERRLHALVVKEARSQFPAVKVAVSTLRQWIKKYNAVGDGGLTAGPSSLIEFRGRPHKL